jgi:hypothetical protein
MAGKRFKRARDPTALAKLIGDIATRQGEDAQTAPTTPSGLDNKAIAMSSQLLEAAAPISKAGARDRRVSIWSNRNLWIDTRGLVRARKVP